MNKPTRSQIWLDFVGVVDAESPTVRLRGNDGGIVEFDPEDVQVSANLISVRLDADARLVEAPPSKERSWDTPPQVFRRSSQVAQEETMTVGLVLFSRSPLRPIGICFDLLGEPAIAAS